MRPFNLYFHPPHIPVCVILPPPVVPIQFRLEETSHRVSITHWVAILPSPHIVGTIRHLENIFFFVFVIVLGPITPPFVTFCRFRGGSD